MEEESSKTLGNSWVLVDTPDSIQECKETGKKPEHHPESDSDSISVISESGCSVGSKSDEEADEQQVVKMEEGESETEETIITEVTSEKVKTIGDGEKQKENEVKEDKKKEEKVRKEDEEKLTDQKKANKAFDDDDSDCIEDDYLYDEDSVDKENDENDGDNDNNDDDDSNDYAVNERIPLNVPEDYMFPYPPHESIIYFRRHSTFFTNALLVFFVGVLILKLEKSYFRGFLDTPFYRVEVGGVCESGTYEVNGQQICHPPKVEIKKLNHYEQNSNLLKENNSIKDDSAYENKEKGDRHKSKDNIEKDKTIHNKHKMKKTDGKSNKYNEEENVQKYKKKEDKLKANKEFDEREKKYNYKTNNDKLFDNSDYVNMDDNEKLRKLKKIEKYLKKKEKSLIDFEHRLLQREIELVKEEIKNTKKMEKLQKKQQKTVKHKTNDFLENEKKHNQDLNNMHKRKPLKFFNEKYYEYKYNKKNNDKNNFTGDWFNKWHEARNHLRKKEHESDWLFERARYRNGKRNKAHWYFQRMFDRERLRSK